MDQEWDSLEFEPSQAIAALTAFCTLYQKEFNADALARECVPPLSVRNLIAIGKQFDLDVTIGRVDLNGLSRPVLVQARASNPDQRRELEWLIVLQRSDTCITYLALGAQQPVEIAAAELEARMTGACLEIRPAIAKATDPDQSCQATEGFGFRWFLPELLKHKAIWREVLGASLVLQLMALGFPLFTQAIIDKVVVHRTESTLIALTVGMAVFVVFTAVLSWIRQYLVLHTGNRVDAVLGSHVFEHLFKLPPLYFQHRPTGVVAARLQGIETIREFVSSAAVTLLLDVPFLLVFVAVMFWYSATLTLIVLAILALIAMASFLVAPLFQRRLNEQFLRGAAN